MKYKDIKIGETYTDNKGNFRLVLDIDPKYVLYNGQACMDNLRYKLIAKKRGCYAVGGEYNSTINSFASWAKMAAQPATAANGN